MKILVFALVVCLATSALLTSKHFEDMGFNMSTPVSERKPLLKAVKTSCENVALSSPPYNYNGTPRLTQEPSRAGTSAPAGEPPLWRSSSTGRRMSVSPT